MRGRLLVSLPHPTRSSRLRARSRAPGSVEAVPEPGRSCPAALLSGSPRVDADGISQVFRRSFPCLCCVPGPRSNQCVLAIHGHIGAAPAFRTTKASARLDFGANPQLRHPLPYASRVALPHTCKARFRSAGSAFAGRESNPLDRFERFQLVLTIILPSCSPDATGIQPQIPSMCLDSGFALRAPRNDGKTFQIPA
jgi:hypothetical protein